MRLRWKRDGRAMVAWLDGGGLAMVIHQDSVAWADGAPEWAWAVRGPGGEVLGSGGPLAQEAEAVAAAEAVMAGRAAG
jgi:hypothetical protein